MEMVDHKSLLNENMLAADIRFTYTQTRQEQPSHLLKPVNTLPPTIILISP